jgi:N-acetyl sugar amidotransferase
MNTKYTQCKRCVLDTSVPDIVFNNNGTCNYCMQYDEKQKNALHYNQEGQRRLEQTITDIKRRGLGKTYDCIIGMSGGVDSTYVAYLVKKKFQLRPLAVHLDNGWNDELAVSNIEKVLKQLDIDLYTKVLDWEEFKDLQVSFLKSSIANAEIPSDHAIGAILFKTAAKENIPYIITGSNWVTEAIMPASWMYDNLDSRLIKAVHQLYGKSELKDFPLMTIWEQFYYLMIKRIKAFPILNYVPYVKTDAKKLLKDEFGWRDYGGKHYESIYTRFFQSYYLPHKFDIDKRKAHLSTLILSKQLTREEAIEELAKPPISSDRLEEDGEYVMKKLGLTYEEFHEIMSDQPKSALDYPNNVALKKRLSSLLKVSKQVTAISRVMHK